ncbi:MULTISPECIES: DUF6861 domain-containing protein [Pseudomonas syringae group]|uniref:NAD(+)--protein-arginine ADP-ribosyltransferase Tre1-like N-terminal domain-containing protein n=3 Tax=Pseudomonas syringae group TaxID=136849 RepID=A0A3M3CHA9_PSESJ|nr:MULTISPECIES: hypothetical protein [Pseudomonas syringae group]MDU8420598.1 hypothetical protein [Pseudomonas syringae]RML53201.1 hypothetical protein ALQ93_01736 [Pseudomonas syringae pv. pisi]RML62104.1 hypothetical protein ALQ92_04047 [Pseudomonas syringae pv. pisi]RMM24338.1 hypothetical protein ALQ82_02632 [Pseudomonas syringae pv. pisi]RMO27471.1 hypothetical protein ALQ44_00835 [Pseudomonas syringae pv. pisi]
MFFFHMLPSWDSIRRQLDRDIAPYRGGHFRTHRNEPVPSPALIMRRFNCVRSAFDRAEWEACRILGQRFVDLDISSIIKDLIDVVTQMAMIVVGSAFVGGVAGASAGALFFGVGAAPGGLMGAALGAQASTFILGILGLESIAESVIDGFPRIIHYYTRGISTAWQGPREQGWSSFMGDDPVAQNSAVQEIAQGHVEVVILLLGAMVQYITRGRGNARALANEMRASAKGERLGQWMLEHEDDLKKRPDLQRPEPGRGALDTQEPPQSPPLTSKNVDKASPEASVPINKLDLATIEVLSIKDAQRLKGDNRGLIFVQEPQGNFDNAFVKFESGTKGALSDVLSQRKAVPALRFDNANPRGNNFVKFDGIEDDGLTLIDRKTSLTTFDKQIQSIQRASTALKQNPQMKGVFEFPDQKNADKALDILIEQNIKNIKVRVAQ